MRVDWERYWTGVEREIKGKAEHMAWIDQRIAKSGQSENRKAWILYLFSQFLIISNDCFQWSNYYDF